MLRALETIATGGSSGRVVTGRTAPAPRTAFLFPGQGSQRTGAGARLYRAEPVFADALDDVLTHLAPHLDLPLRDIMFAEPGTERAALLHRTRCTQPALFALAVALFRLMDHRGVRPASSSDTPSAGWRRPMRRASSTCPAPARWSPPAAG
nr:acyltransferase domain-containing protein [Streptomyces clavuligerus]